MNIKALPGLALIEPLTEESLSGLNTGVAKKRILKGKIVKMGADDMNNYGGIAKADSYGKEGDTVYFLSYYEEGGYDQVKIDGVTYYVVKFGDLRLNIE